jgi:AraC-like DNA-binding protein
MSVPVELGSAIILSCPIYASLFAFLLMCLDMVKVKAKGSKINYVLMAYFFCSLLSWCITVIYFCMPVFYICINSLGMLAFMLMQVFFYQFIFEVTKVSDKESFSIWHSVVPVFFSLILLILTVFTPFDYLLNVRDAQGYFSGDIRLFLIVSGNRMLVRTVFSLVYLVFGCRRLLIYRNFIRNYASNAEKASLGWVWLVVVLSMVVVPIPLFWLFFSKGVENSSFLTSVQVLLLLGQYVYLCLYVIRRDEFMVMISADSEKIKKQEGVLLPESPVLYEDAPISFKKSLLNKELFEAYMLNRKPYLNPDLRITDLVEVFRVNRTYISSFINVEYGMHFSSYINKYRMMEFKRLMSLPENVGLSKQVAAELAGFNSYRSFMRFQKEEG